MTVDQAAGGAYAAAAQLSATMIVNAAAQPGQSDTVEGDKTTDSLEPSGITVGATAGSFDVSESGAATYSIPIALPPGTAGMVPSIGLSMSSQGSGGLVGVGWSLNGFSAVHRCPKNYYTDNIKGLIAYTSADPFCLDGQRLIEYTPGIYRTERDSFSRITQITDGWKVETKSGLIMYYGTDDAGVGAGNARLAVVNNVIPSINGAVKIWSLSKAIDRKGNYYLVEYEKDANELAQRPLRVRYTGNAAAGITPYASVEFTYEANLTGEQGLMYDSAGSASQQTKRLSVIATKFGTQSVRTYSLAYRDNAVTNRSLLSSIAECGVSLNGSLCLPATNVAWNTPESVPYTPTFANQGTLTNPDFKPPVDSKTYVVDLNGDGKSDILQYKGLNAGTGLHEWKVIFGGTTNAVMWTSTSGATRIVLGDFNGDGKTDFISEANNVWTRCLVNASINGFSCNTITTFAGIIPNVPADPFQAMTLSGDFDGDGRIDIAFYKDRFGSASRWIICLADTTASGFTCTGPYIGPNETTDFAGPKGKVVGDFNGDGRADIAGYGRQGVDYTNNWQVAFSNFTIGQTGFTLGPADTKAVYSWPQSTSVADINGDGLADLVSGDDNAPDGVRSWNVCLSKGDGTFDCTRSPGRLGNITEAILGDFNGDGRTDIAQYNDGTDATYPPGWRVCLSSGLVSTGTSFNCSNWGSVGLHNGNILQGNLTGDFDGSGKTKIAALRSDNSNWDILGAGGVIPDMPLSVTDGLGKTVNFSYAPLTEAAGTVYTKGTAAAFPAIDIQSPMYVVSSMSTNDGIGGMRSFSYNYKGLQGHSQGAGLLGFAERTVTDVLTGRTTKTTYSQDYANRFAGTPLTSEVRSSSGALLSRSSSTPGMKTLTGVTGLTIWQAYTTQSFAETFDPNVSTTAPYVTSTTTTALGANIDINGNVLSSSTFTSDGFSKSTSTTYFPDDTTNWLLGRPQRVSVTSTNPATMASSKTRTSAFTYATGTHLVETETIEPDATDETKVTTTHGYDSVGNRSTTTVDGVGLTGRTATVIYGDAYKRFATTATNILGHSATSVYDDLHGTVKQTTDANGLFGISRNDRLGRKVASYSSQGVNQAMTYAAGSGAAANSVMTITSTTSGSAPSISYVDLLGREIRREGKDFGGNAVYAITTYDARGRKTYASRPFSGAAPTSGTTMSYTGEDDKLDRVTSDTAPDGGLTAYGYAGFTGTVTRYPGGTAPAQTTSRVTNSQGWTLSTTDAANAVTNYTYDALGNLLTVAKPGGGVVQMTYDIRSRKKTLVDPDAGTITYAYNAAGELLNEAVTGGRSSSSVYDNLGRLSSRTEVANGKTYTTTNTYDCANAKGKLCTESLAQPTGSNSRSYTRDVLSRATQANVTTVANGQTRNFTSTTNYDSLSRTKQYTYPVTGLTVTTEYNALGYATALKELNGANTITHWQANGRNADGQINNMTVGGVTITKQYDGVGRVKNINTGTMQAASYDWDQIGNLTRRGDSAVSAVSGANEYFCYDPRNRVTGSGAAAGSCAVSFNYDVLGNLTKAVNTGAVAYVANTNKLNNAYGGTVTYDAGGNIKFDGKRTYTYSAFDIPDTISQTVSGAIYTSEWGFGPDKQRTYEWDTQKASVGAASQPVGLTWYAGAGHFEVDETSVNGVWQVQEFRHFLKTPEGNVGITVMNGNGSVTDRYFIQDHLGSSAGTIVNGVVETRAAYDVWGGRINSGVVAQSGWDTSQRGFTGHEHLATYGLIHMNGRIYDSVLGRFLQADPIIQSPYDLQSYNRYAYVMNNPLAFTDPSGYSWHRKQWLSFAFCPACDKQVFRFTASIAVGFILGPAGSFGSWVGGSSFLTSAAAGFASGGISGGNSNSALQGAFSAAAFNVAGDIANTHNLTGADFGTARHFGGIVAHAIVGCATSAAGGGSCKAGASSAGFGMLLTPGIAALSSNQVTGTLAAAIAGAIGSKLGGGSYESGAVSGAFGYLFNQLSTAVAAPTGEIGAAATNSCNRCAIRTDEGFDELLQPIERRMTWEQKYERNMSNLFSRAMDLMGPGFAYSLRATVDGFYPNLRGDFLIYMYAGDVWKYGETFSPQARYSRSFLETNKVVMVPESGPTTAFTAKTIEQGLLLYYTFRHGDLPPANRIMR